MRGDVARDIGRRRNGFAPNPLFTGKSGARVNGDVSAFRRFWVRDRSEARHCEARSAEAIQLNDLRHIWP
jgi:hypothetical protein